MKSRNILNMESLDEYCTRLATIAARAKHEPAAKWFKTTFRSWLQNTAPVVQYVILEDVLHTPSIRLMLAVSDPVVTKAWLDTNHAIDSAGDLPEWAQKQLAENKPLFWFNSRLDQDAFNVDIYHLLDYFNEFESKDKVVSSTVPVILEKLEQWDKRLAKQKLISELSVGTVLLESFSHPDYILVKLATEEAYKNEGAAMSHCVARYFGSKDTKILSLRSPNLEWPLATIEVSRSSSGKKVIVQVRARFNDPVLDDVHKAIVDWAASSDIAVANYAFKKNRDEDEDDEEYDEEYDEDEDDEDDILVDYESDEVLDETDAEVGYKKPSKDSPELW